MSNVGLKYGFTCRERKGIGNKERGGVKSKVEPYIGPKKHKPS